MGVFVCFADWCSSGEILSLKWKDVDLGRRVAVVTAENAKSGKARPLPLNDDAVAVMREIPFDNEYVFSADGEKEGYINRTDFERALLLSGITDFRFHDLRHTWASWHVQNGTPLMVLKELGGWEKLEMVNKYAHLSGEHLSKFSGIVTFWHRTPKAKRRCKNFSCKLMFYN